MRSTVTVAAVLAAVLVSVSHADVIESSPTHFVLRHEATSVLSVEDMWARLLVPGRWWHPDHTYSGDANNLSLDASAGGLWREDWPQGSVLHGQVLLVQQAKLLRLNAPFGPLQGVGAHTIWTITLQPNGVGCRVIFDEVANGPPTAKLDTLATAVDGVKAQALARLVDAKVTSSE